MINKEFLAQFSRHLLRSAYNLSIESPQAAIPATTAIEINKTEIAEMEPFEAEKKRAEEMMRMKPQLQPTAKMPIDISRIGDREFALPPPKISEQESSLRRELEKARERVIKSIAPPARAPMIRPPMMRPLEIKSPMTSVTEAETSFSLGKLNIFVKNPEINAIECNGPDNVLVVRKGIQAINTTTTLSNDEINDILHKFSVESKTEITPIFKATANDLMLTAFVSPIIGTRFVLSKSKK